VGPQLAVSKLKRLHQQLGEDFGLETVSLEYEKDDSALRGSSRDKINKESTSPQILGATNDPMLALQTHYDAIKLPQAWDIMNQDPNTWANAKDVVVQVLDSGMDFSHEDLGDNVWINPNEICGDGIDNDGNGFDDDCHGYNHANDAGWPVSELLGGGDHGSHCTGTIAANTNNGVGVAGIAGGGNVHKGVSIMTSVGFGYGGAASGFAEALVYAADNGAKVSSNRYVLFLLVLLFF
jgi:subtilisin family serine protease